MPSLLTYNLNFENPKQWENLDTYLQQKHTFYCLQEVTENTLYKFFTSNYLQTYYFSYCPSFRRQGKVMYLLILSQWPIKAEYGWFSNKLENKKTLGHKWFFKHELGRGFLACKIVPTKVAKIFNQPIWLHCIHKEVACSPLDRQNIWNAYWREFMQKTHSKTARHLIAGDFNAYYTGLFKLWFIIFGALANFSLKAYLKSEHLFYKKWQKENNFKEIKPVASFKILKLKLDRILYSSNIRIRKQARLDSLNSDHFPRVVWF